MALSQQPQGPMPQPQVGPEMDFVHNELPQQLQQFLEQNSGTPQAAEYATRTAASLYSHALAVAHTNEAAREGDALAANLSASAESYTALAAKGQVGQAIAGFQRDAEALSQAYPEARTHLQTAADNFTRQIIKSGIQGAIVEGRDPKPLFEQYGQYIGKDLPALEKSAQTYGMTLQLDRLRLQNALQSQADRATRTAIFGQVKVDPATGQELYPPNYTEQIMREVQAGALSPSTADTMIRSYHTNLVFGTQTHDDPGSVAALRTAIGSGSATQNDLNQAYTARKITTATYNAYSNLLAKPKPEDPITRNAIAGQRSAISSLTMGDGGNQAALNGYYSQKMAEGQELGWSQLSMNTPGDPHYWLGPNVHTGADIETAMKAVYTNPPAQNPLNTMQMQLSDAADQAAHVASLMAQTGNAVGVARVLEGAGYPISPADVASGRFCADMVNGALKRAGIAGTGSSLAKSFTTWGVAADPANLQKGDVFYESPGVTGLHDTSGHVGFVLGPAQDGRVLTISSTEGERGGKPVWRPVAGLQFRAPRASIGQIYQAAANQMPLPAVPPENLAAEDRGVATGIGGLGAVFEKILPHLAPSLGGLENAQQ